MQDRREAARQKVISFARHTIANCDQCIQAVQRHAEQFPEQQPIDCEDFRVVRYYAVKVLNAALEGAPIDPRWLDEIAPAPSSAE